jgi:MFS family permease
MAIPDIISAIGSPLCGWLLDRVARNAAKKSSAFSSAAQQQRPVRAFFLPLSGLFLVIVHTLLGFTNISPIFALFILGLAYSLFGAALWPMIPHLVANNRLLGTAYGVSTVALNIALTFVPLIVAKILNAGSYVSVEIWFIILSSLGLALSIMVGIFDQRRYSSRYGSMPNDDADDDDVPTALDDNQFQSEDEEVDGNEYKPLLVHTKAAPSYAHLYDEDGNGEFDEGVLKDDDFETELVGDHHIVTIPKRPHIPSHPHSRHNHHHHHRPSDNK